MWRSRSPPPAPWPRQRRPRRQGQRLALLKSARRSPHPCSIRLPPRPDHKTTSDKIFLIGSAPPSGSVTVNGQAIKRSKNGHFAPSFGLQLGENRFVLSDGRTSQTLVVTRTDPTPAVPTGLNFAPDSLVPAVDMARQVGERVCFGAIAPPNAQVTLLLGNQKLPLTATGSSVDLPPNSAVLTGDTGPTQRSSSPYQACTSFTAAGTLQPQYQLSLNGQTKVVNAPGKLQILAPEAIRIATVTATEGTARTGPSTSYSRLTPLPKGTQASITGEEGEWVRLDYGAWIRKTEVAVINAAVPPETIIRGLSSRVNGDWTELVLPLQTPVPITIDQDTTSLTLTLHNTTAQTDTIYTSQDPVIERLDWQQPRPGEARYTVHFKGKQQWGYKTRYDGTTLILSLKHPPKTSAARPLQGLKIFIDPGHGSENDLGARGPTGYPEKDVALKVSKLVRDELQARGATVIMAREGDDDLWPHDRVERMEAAQPDLAFSLHYNALPDAGDAEGTQGIGMFWYQPQAHGPSQFLHDYLTQKLNRPSYGVFWNNLALTRPSLAPAVLVEFGFMINPEEFEWIVDEASQEQLAQTFAEGVEAWAKQAL
ncbi:MAG: N-acetylmuramoyl-L-alanine amidase [Synechococcales cyanobacterium RM1_1_8]|nr:N-acetylmuramoyl-L-alanine amidase [Synechococcales cyanobacterium RM1_1_8]